MSARDNGLRASARDARVTRGPVVAPNVEFSVVICSVDAAKFARVRASYSRLLAGRAFEILGIHDAKSLAEGYARGVAASAGSLLILSHDDIEILTPDFADRVVRHLAAFDLIGVAGTTRLVGGGWADAGDPYRFSLVTTPQGAPGTLRTKLTGGGDLVVPDIQALDGVFWALRRDVALRVGFDGATFDGFHLCDLDFTFRAALAGYRLAVCRDIALIHESLGSYDAVWQHYRRRFEEKFAGRLAAKGTSRIIARVAVDCASREEVIAFCEPARLAATIRGLDRTLQATAASVSGQ
jgi:Glycosyltransferase like family